MYHALTGQSPFVGQDPVQVLYQVIHHEPESIRKTNPTLSLDLVTITQKCMSKQPQDRIKSAAELARELELYLNGEPICSRPINGFVRMKRWCSRHPALAFLTSTTVVALLLGSVISIYFGLLAEQRSNRLTQTNVQLKQAEQKARRSADDAQLHASVATTQANIALQALESTLYDLQKVVIDDPAQQEQRRHLLKSVLSGLDDLNAGVVSADRILRCRATAIYGLAEVAHQLGDDSEQSGATASVPLFKEAIKDFQIIFDKNPENLMSALDLIDALSAFGEMLADAGRWQEARSCFQRALPICTKLATAQPDAPTTQGKLLELEVLSAEAMINTGIHYWYMEIGTSKRKI